MNDSLNPLSVGQTSDNESQSMKPASSHAQGDDIDSVSFNPDYPGNLVDDEIPEGGYQKCSLDFPNPFILLCFFDPAIANQLVTLHPWQMDDLKSLGSGAPLTCEGEDSQSREYSRPTAHHPYKYCLIAANGSGKDKYILAPFAIWFTLTKIRSRCIITTSSGTQLTSQTEPYIKDLAEKVNAYFGQEIFRVRQRFIRCLLTGSEIRLFATDEAGKAEGYHPIDHDSEMAIIENEAKSVTEGIDQALRRCNGYNYWLKVSSAGEPKGHFYVAATRWRHVRRVTSYECLHISREEIKEDMEVDGKHSAFFRSKHLSLFTSIGGQVIIPLETVNYCLEFPPKEIYFPETRIGIDLAAGGAENALCFTKGNKCTKEIFFREKDTTLCASRIDSILKQNNIPKTHQHIYADDGGVGRAIIDMLIKMGWHINRVMNQWAALGNRKQYGNRGAENWYRIARIIEEKMFDLRGLSELTREQLYTRSYKQSLTGGKIYLQDKREAIAHGFPSPDRADAFILSLTGLTLDDFIRAQNESIKDDSKTLNKKKEQRFTSQEELLAYYEEKTFSNYEEQQTKPSSGKRLYNSLRNALHSNN